MTPAPATPPAPATGGAAGDGFVLRVYVAHTGRGRATVRLPFAAGSAEAVDLMEWPRAEDGPVAVEGGVLAFDVRPSEIRSVRLRPA